MNRVEHALAAMESSRRRLLAEIEGLDDARFAQHPPRGGWSVGQVVEHVARSESAIARGFSTVIESRRVPSPRRGDGLRKLLLTLRLYDLVSFRTTEGFDPSEPPPRPEALAHLAGARAALLAAVGESPSRIAGVKLRHPIFGLLSGLEMLGFATMHEERHRRQIVRIRAAIGAG